MRSTLLGVVLAASLAVPALAQPRGGFGGRGFGGGMHRPGGFAGRAAGRFHQRFDQANITHDGKLTLQQARDGNMPAVARHFNEIDTAHKGYITMDDVRAYRQNMMTQRRAAQGGDDTAGAGAGAIGPNPSGPSDGMTAPPQ